MRKLRLGSTFVIAAVAMASVAVPTLAQSGAPPAACTPTDPQLNVVFIPKNLNNPYFDAAELGGQKAATELCGLISMVGPQDPSAAGQVPFIQDTTTTGASAIAIAAQDPDAIAPSLKDAMSKGIYVVGFDSPPAVGAYNVFVNQVDFSGVGTLLAEWACELAPDCSGQIAILSAAETSPNQNAWIAGMKETLTQDKYKNLELVATVYGNDKSQDSTVQAQGLLQTYPDLKVIVSPTSIGIVAASQVVEQAKSSVKVTGLGFPNEMRTYVKNGTAPVFGLWSVPDLGYLTYYIANLLVTKQIDRCTG